MKFSGGVHPKEEKITKHYRISVLQTPQILVLPLSQHTGKPSIPLLKTGDYVLRGQKIAQPDGLISASLHSPVSGKIVGINEVIHPTLCKKTPAIIIESDGHNKTVEFNTKYKEYFRYSPEELVNHVKESGMVGLGGAAFPTHVNFLHQEIKLLTM